MGFGTIKNNSPVIDDVKIESKEVEELEKQLDLVNKQLSTANKTIYELKVERKQLEKKLADESGPKRIDGFSMTVIAWDDLYPAVKQYYKNRGANGRVNQLDVINSFFEGLKKL